MYVGKKTKRMQIYQRYLSIKFHWADDILRYRHTYMRMLFPSVFSDYSSLLDHDAALELAMVGAATPSLIRVIAVTPLCQETAIATAPDAQKHAHCNLPVKRHTLGGSDGSS